MNLRLFILCAFLFGTSLLKAFTAIGTQEPQPAWATSSEVPVTLTSNLAAVAMQADVLFDESKYIASNAVDGNQPDGIQVQSRVMEPGRLRVVVFHRHSGALSSDVVFQVPLTAKSGVVTDDPVVLTNFIVASQGGGKLTTSLQPKVRLVNLRDGQNINGRFGIELSATAATSASTISSLEYYVGGLKVGEGNGANFRFLWIPPSSGPFEITAVAYDSNGQQSSTRTVPVVVTHVGTYTGPVLGSYFGLVRGQTFSFANDGYVTMTSTTAGNFTLRMLTGGKTWSSSGKFDTSGNATVSISRGKGITPLTLVLAHSSTPPVDQIHGRVADGPFVAGKFTGNTFQTEFTVDRVVWKLKTREAPQNGAYTMLLPAHDDALLQNAPLGTGYGTVTASKDGRVRLAGSLADGTTVTASSFLSKDGIWPLYASLYRNKGVILGQQTFVDVPGVSDFDGPLTWMRPADAKAAMFKTGFTTETDAVGSRFLRPAVNTRLFPMQNVGGNSQLFLTEGGLTNGLTRFVTLSAANKAVVPLQDADAATLLPAPTTGLFTGSFLHPQIQKATSIKGAMLQKQKLAAGYFLAGTNGGDMRYAANAVLPPGAGDEGSIGTAPLPTVKITSPAANSTLAGVVGGVVQIKGTATDKQGISRVKVQVLHDGVLSAEATATGTTAWTYDLPVASGEGGHYTVFAKAIDSSAAEDESEVVTHSFWAPLKSALTVAVNDLSKGSVSTGYLGSTQRDVGKLVTITATPKAKKKFLGWTGSLTSSSPKITVQMKVGTTLTANFGD